MNWAAVAPIVISAAGTLGLSQLLQLLVTRRSRRQADSKVQVDTASVISAELRQWTTQAETRARAAESRAEKAEERADQTETRLQARIDQMGEQIDGMKHDVERMRVLIRDCTAGPPCPVRIAIDRSAS